jgi:tRNA-modifying protein YgfZ
MPDNPPPVPELEFALPGHRIVAIDGPQAPAFAQAQFMNDVASLQAGHWQWNGWLSPKGRLIALFALLVTSPESVLLLLPDADGASFVAQLQRFVFRSRVAIASRDDLVATGSFRAADSATGNAFSRAAADTFELDVSGDLGPRTLRIGPVHVAGNEQHAAYWTASDLAYGFPRLPEPQAAQWTPQQLSLDRLRAYSVKKGCYPGQEIVARTHFLGQAKRGLALFEADGWVTAGSDVSDGERPLGTVIATAPHAAGTRLLAVLPLDFADTTLAVDGASLRPQALASGLAR